MSQDMFKTISLNQVLSELAEEIDLKNEKKIKDGKKYAISKLEFSDPRYKNYIKQYKEELTKIFEALGLNLENFKNNNSNKYEIPRVMGEVLKTYLLEDGKKGSLKSKIKNKNLENIGKDERIEYNERIFNRLLNVIDEEEFKKELLELKEGSIKGIEYFFDINELIKETTDKLKKAIDEKKNVILKADERVGLIHLSDITEKKEFTVEKNRFNKEDMLLAQKRLQLASLDKNDLIQLINILQGMIDETINKWDEIVLRASLIREENIHELEMNKEDSTYLGKSIEFIDSKTLAEEAKYDIDNNISF